MYCGLKTTAKSVCVDGMNLEDHMIVTARDHSGLLDVLRWVCVVESTFQSNSKHSCASGNANKVHDSAKSNASLGLT